MLGGASQERILLEGSIMEKPLTRFAWFKGFGAVLTSRTVLLILLVLCAACSSLSEKEETALNLYKQNSKSYYNTGNYVKAIDQCYKGLELDENDFSLNLTLGWSLLRAGGKANLFASLSQFEKTLDLGWFDEDYRVLLGLGEVCYRIAILYNNKLDEYELLASQPGAESLYDEEIETCRRDKDRYLNDAINYLKAVLENERQRENIDALLTLGQAYAYLGDLDQAVQSISKGLELLESSTSFQQLKLDSDQSITGDGRRFFERQIKRNLKLEKELRGLLAFVFQRQNNHAKALEQYDTLAERDLFDNVQHYNRGVSLQELGRYEEAIKEFENFLSRASIAGKQFDEDEHFHRAFERIATCRSLARQAQGL